MEDLVENLASRFLLCMFLSIQIGGSMSNSDKSVISNGKAIKHEPVQKHKSIQDVQGELVKEFSIFDTVDDKLSYLNGFGRGQSGIIDESCIKEGNTIHGCVTRAWLKTEIKDGQVNYKAYSHDQTIKGILALLVGVMSHHEAEEIIDAELTCIEDIGLSERLGRQTCNSINAIVEQMKLEALELSQKQK